MGIFNERKAPLSNAWKVGMRGSDYVDTIGTSEVSTERPK
jgi:hypothetical protein